MTVELAIRLIVLLIFLPIDKVELTVTVFIKANDLKRLAVLFTVIVLVIAIALPIVDESDTCKSINFEINLINKVVSVTT